MFMLSTDVLKYSIYACVMHERNLNLTRMAEKTTTKAEIHCIIEQQEMAHCVLSSNIYINFLDTDK